MEELLEEMKAQRVTELQAMARLAKAEVVVQTQWVVAETQLVVAEMQWVVAETRWVVAETRWAVVMVGVMQAHSS